MTVDHAVLAGLGAAISRGDFDTEKAHINLPEMRKEAKNDGTPMV